MLVYLIHFACADEAQCMKSVKKIITKYNATKKHTCQISAILDFPSFEVVTIAVVGFQNWKILLLKDI